MAIEAYAKDSAHGANPVPGWWDRLRRRWAEPPVRDAAELEAFVDAQAAFIAQKCAVDYCRGKTGVASAQLFHERPFQDALAVCRWESFAAVLADVLIVTENWLRPRGLAASGKERLAGMYAAILQGQPAPVHRPHGWNDLLPPFADRFAAALAAPARAPAEVAQSSARRMFDTLPIHPSMRELDQPVVFAAVQFQMVGMVAVLTRRADLGRLVASLNA